MNTNDQQRDQRANLRVSQEILAQIKISVEELNFFFDETEKSRVIEPKKQSQKPINPMSIPEKLTIKSFTEGAISYAIKHKIDPRFYTDSTTPMEISRLRNHVMSFIKKQETLFFKPLVENISVIKTDFQQNNSLLKDKIDKLNKNVDDEVETTELTALETQSHVIGLVHVLFDILEVDEIDRKKMEDLLQKKAVEYRKSNL